MKRFLTLAVAAVAGLLAGCSTPTIASDMAVHNTMPPMTLTETAAKLDLKIEEAEFWGDRYAVAADGSRFLIKKDNQRYWFNNAPRSVEYPGITYDRARRELLIPVSMFNDMARDVQRRDMVINTRKTYEVDDSFVPTTSVAPLVIEVRDNPAPRPASVPVAPAPTPRSGALSGLTVFVDAGHGGKDPGAVQNGLNEKDLALSISRKLEPMLKAQGARVIMARTTDVYLTLAERAERANASGADIFISVHANSATNTSAHGIETWFDAGGSRGAQSASLARFVNDGMVAATGANDRGPRADQRGLYVLRNTRMPAILVEAGFMSNAAEASRLSRSDYQDKVARGVADGVLAWVGQQNPSLSR